MAGLSIDDTPHRKITKGIATMPSPQTATFLVMGPRSDTFIASVATEGVLVVNENLMINLIATSVPSDSEAWRESITNILGIVLLVDGTHPDTFAQIPLMVDRLGAEQLPLIVAVDKQNEPKAQPPKAIRDLLPEDTPIKVFPCIASDKQSAENVLLALIYSVLSGDSS